VQFVGHAHGAANLGDRHVRANVNIAQLRDAQAVERGREIRDRNFDFTNLKVQPFGNKAVSGADERNSPCENTGSLKEVAARMIDPPRY